MSDTVPASVIAASLAESGPGFMLDLGAAAGADMGDFHVSGAVQVSSVSASGSPLLVDFVTWYPVPALTVAPPTVAGAGASEALRDIAPAVAGSVNTTFDHLP
jgi:hypothetical protein